MINCRTSRTYLVLRSGSYTPGGYAGDAPPAQCPAWMQANQVPAGCDANQAPPPVTPSDPPCGPDGSMASQLLPQYFADACTAHDICYSVLGSDKGNCDSAFQTNMYRTCEAQHLPTTACRTFMIQGGQRVCASSDLTYHASVCIRLMRSIPACNGRGRRRATRSWPGWRSVDNGTCVATKSPTVPESGNPAAVSGGAAALRGINT